MRVQYRVEIVENSPVQLLGVLREKGVMHPGLEHNYMTALPIQF